MMSDKYITYDTTTTTTAFGAPAPGKIYGKLAAILAEFPVVTKDRENAHFRYKFRGIDDALAAAHGLFAKHGVFCMVESIEKVDWQDAGNGQVRAVLEGRVRFYADDGSFVEGALVGEGVDKGDKGLMKAQANALKYVFWYTFCVPTDEPKDSEAFPEPEGVKAPKKSRAVKQTPQMDNSFYLESIAKADKDGLTGIVTMIKAGLSDLPAEDQKVLVDAIRARRKELGE